MTQSPARRLSQRLPALTTAAALCCLAAQPARAAEEADAPKGASVTVLKAAKACFPAIVEVSGIVRARDETAVRPERQDIKVTKILADAGYPRSVFER
jgi:hypothetical protein